MTVYLRSSSSSSRPLGDAQTDQTRVDAGATAGAIATALPGILPSPQALVAAVQQALPSAGPAAQPAAQPAARWPAWAWTLGALATAGTVGVLAWQVSRRRSRR